MLPRLDPLYLPSGCGNQWESSPPLSLCLAKGMALSPSPALLEKPSSSAADAPRQISGF